MAGMSVLVVVLVAVVAFVVGLLVGLKGARVPVAPAPAQAVAAALPKMLASGPTDAKPERFTLYVDGDPIASGNDWREVRDLWRAADPSKRVVWDRERGWR